MSKLTNKKSIEFVISNDDGSYFNIRVSRTVPGRDCAPYMNIEAYISNDMGDHNDDEKVLDISGIDVLDVYELLNAIRPAISDLTGVHDIQVGIPVPAESWEIRLAKDLADDVG